MLVVLSLVFVHIVLAQMKDQKTDPTDEHSGNTADGSLLQKIKGHWERLAHRHVHAHTQTNLSILKSSIQIQTKWTAYVMFFEAGFSIHYFSGSRIRFICNAK